MYVVVCLLEEGHDLAGELLGGAEALRVEHHLRDELSIGLGHRQTAEEFLQVIRQIRAARVARVHGDEDGHVGVDLDLCVSERMCACMCVLRTMTSGRTATCTCRRYM